MWVFKLGWQFITVMAVIFGVVLLIGHPQKIPYFVVLLVCLYIWTRYRAKRNIDVVHRKEKTQD